MWKCNGGYFDLSGKEIDHKVERACGGTDDISNLQVLCPCCHSYKTRKYMSNKGIATEMLDLGVQHMDIDNTKCPRAKKTAAIHDLKMRDPKPTNKRTQHSPSNDIVMKDRSSSRSQSHSPSNKPKSKPTAKKAKKVGQLIDLT